MKFKYCNLLFCFISYAQGIGNVLQESPQALEASDKINSVVVTLYSHHNIRNCNQSLHQKNDKKALSDLKNFISNYVNAYQQQNDTWHFPKAERMELAKNVLEIDQHRVDLIIVDLMKSRSITIKSDIMHDQDSEAEIVINYLKNFMYNGVSLLLPQDYRRNAYEIFNISLRKIDTYLYEALECGELIFWSYGYEDHANQHNIQSDHDFDPIMCWRSL